MNLFSHFGLGNYTTSELIWLAVGLIGQTLFFMRFLVQWIVSEKEKRSVIPDIFWWFSISGGVILLAYALHRKDIVFTLGQSIGVFVYVRNIMLLHATKKKAAA